MNPAGRARSLAAGLVVLVALSGATSGAGAEPDSSSLLPPGPLSAAAASAIRAALPLRVPVGGVDPDALVNSFDQRRGNDRAHQALDILAPRGTPVCAVDDGTVIKLFDSEPGGLTVYQFDRSRTLAYYYAHLDRYAAGLAEGQVVRRGDLLGYVGTTGNADPAVPHLHFAVFELGPGREWWKGRAISPVPLMRVPSSPP